MKKTSAFAAVLFFIIALASLGLGYRFHGAVASELPRWLDIRVITR